MKLKLIQWNVNCIRAIYRKGLLDWLEDESPDMLCINETKSWSEQLSEDLLIVEGYKS